ncbi:MAG: NAD(P)/FAD-dependent oxidoreductase [Rickettsiales bacterium]
MEKFDVVIVGAGFSGLYLLYRLRREGFSVRLLEAQSGLGGVWQANRYPGARVDSHVPNYEYSMEACWRDWVWSERFPGRDELVRYFEHVDRALDLGREIELVTRIATCRFTRDGSWTLTAEDGRRYDCAFLVMCTGFGSKPYTPDLPGLASFAGTCHHTAMWPEDGVDFAGQRVGIIGTGASGVQVVQEAAPLVRHDDAANRAAYDFWRDKVRARIDDPELADLLAPMEPPYPFGTKRPSLEQGYYECFNRPNVELVDLNATPLDRIVESGVRTSETTFELDVLVLATGFDANTGGLTAIDIRGCEDVALAAAWSGGVDTHLGVAVPGFPNMLMLYGPQSATAFCNGPTCAEFQGDWTIRLLQHMRACGHSLVETTVEAGAAWSTHLAEMAESTLFGRTDSWYMGANIPGKPRQLLNYPDSDAYRYRLRDCEANGYDGFVLQ